MTLQPELLITTDKPRIQACPAALHNQVQVLAAGLG